MVNSQDRDRQSALELSEREMRELGYAVIDAIVERTLARFAICQRHALPIARQWMLCSGNRLPAKGLRRLMCSIGRSIR